MNWWILGPRTLGTSGTPPDLVCFAGLVFRLLAGLCRLGHGWACMFATWKESTHVVCLLDSWLVRLELYGEIRYDQIYIPHVPLRRHMSRLTLRHAETIQDTHLQIAHFTATYCNSCNADQRRFLAQEVRHCFILLLACCLPAWNLRPVKAMQRTCPIARPAAVKPEKSMSQGVSCAPPQRSKMHGKRDSRPSLRRITWPTSWWPWFFWTLIPHARISMQELQVHHHRSFS